METTLGQRLNSLIEEKNISKKKLAEAVGVHPSAITQFVQGKNNPKLDTSQKIAQFFGVEIEWFLIGKGQKLKQLDPVLLTEGTLTFKENDVATNNSERKSVRFNAPQKEPHLSSLITDLKPEFTPVPFIPVSARASFTDRFSDMDFEEMGTFPVYDLDPALVKKGAVVIEVNGDSMEPQLRNRGKVLALPVDPGDWQYQSSGVYALVFDSQFTIKRIVSNTLAREGGEIELKADNGGGTMIVPGKAVRKIWKIVRMVDAEVA